jgi:inosose dehydratase
MKVAGAPISWGVSELPDWGYRMDPKRVLGEMGGLGLSATELGPPGFLPEDPRELRELLDDAGLKLAAGFLAVVLHDRGHRESAVSAVRREAEVLAVAGADVLVLAAALPGQSYDRREHLGKDGWQVLTESLAVAAELSATHGLELAFHPHVGTAVEAREDVTRLLETTDIAMCVDTGHLFLGGADPAEVVRAAGARVRHVHLKDVDATIAASVRSGERSYGAAVRSGLYRPLGSGDLDIGAVLGRLGDFGYEGWYVLEQDTALTAGPEPASGPVVGVRQSLDFFRAAAHAQGAATSPRGPSRSASQPTAESKED